MQQPFNWTEVHLVAWVLRTCQVGCFRCTRLHNALDRLTIACQLEVVSRDLDGHPFFNVSLCALQDLQTHHLIIAIEGHHVLWRFLVKERSQTIHDFAFVTGVFNCFQEGSFAISRYVFRFLNHLWRSVYISLLGEKLLVGIACNESYTVAAQMEQNGQKEVDFVDRGTNSGPKCPPHTDRAASGSIGPG